MAAKTKTKDKTQDKQAPQPAENAGSVVPAPNGGETSPGRGLRLRIPYPAAWGQRNGVDADAWRILLDSAWPSARTAEAVTLAFGYCKWRNLDPLKKMIHIVPVWDKNLETVDDNGRTKRGGWSEGVWPGIAEIRVTATRTGVYAGKDAMEFGPSKTRTFKGVREVWKTVNGNRQKAEEEHSLELTYPEWARLTVYKIVQGIVCKFVGPQVLWEEAYATESRTSEVPNEMWADRKQGQLDKCAEAAALRSAFPEELGGEHAAEEMYGRTVEGVPKRDIPGHVPLLTGEVRPTAVQAEEFQRKEPEKPKTDAKPADAAETPKGDPRPEPPAEGQVVKQPDPPPPADDGAMSEEELKVLYLILEKSMERLGQIAKVGQLADLRDEIEQELPPESELLKKWLKACEEKQEQIVKAGKVKK